jgi:hypothetical protein
MLRALPAPHRLASAHAALGTRRILILGQAPGMIILQAKRIIIDYDCMIKPINQDAFGL